MNSMENGHVELLSFEASTYNSDIDGLSLSFGPFLPVLSGAAAIEPVSRESIDCTVATSDAQY